MQPAGDAIESPRDRIKRLVAEGRLPGAAVAAAEALWQERLHDGVQLPNGDVVHVTRDDLYHVLVDDRIWRHPERIELALTHVFEIRALEHGKRLAFSRWIENDRERLAVLVLYPDKTLRMLHLIDDRRLRRYTRNSGELLWRH